MTLFFWCWNWQSSSRSLMIGGAITITGCLAIAFSGNKAVAQITPDRTLGTESSVVTPNINIRGHSADRIDGGATRGANLFHSFQEFNIGEGRAAYFANPAAIENIFSRVTGSNPSSLLGTLGVLGKANLFFLNPNGILFGPNAQLDIRGSFVASTTSRLTFPNGTEYSATNPEAAPLLTINVPTPIGLQFEMSQPGAIVNAGNLAVKEGQNLSLIGGTVVNTGSLEALEGSISVAAMPGSSQVRLSKTGQISDLEIETPTNGQKNLAISPLTLSQLLTTAGVGLDMGVTVKPDGTGLLAKSGINFPTVAGTSIIAGHLNVSGNTGGVVNVLGNRVGLINANINASGSNGGGIVLIGGDYQGKGTVPNASGTFVSSGSVINADALLRGDGGRVIVWADRTTGFYGNISAKGGLNGGNGGFVEVSGKQDLLFRGNVDLSALGGNLGTLLLDPTNILIVAGGAGTGANDAALADGSILFTDSPGATFTISQGTLETQLGAVTLQAADNITISSGVSLNFMGGGEISFTADADNNGVGSFLMNPGDTITAPGRNVTITGASITTGNINTRGGISAPGGSVSLSAMGNITTGSLTVYADSDVDDTPTPNFFNGGNIRIISTQGAIDTSAGILAAGAAQGRGGNISLVAKNNITTARITTGAVTGEGSGGNISLISREGSIDISRTAPIDDDLKSGLNGGFVGQNSGSVIIDAALNITTGDVIASGTTGGDINLISRNGSIDSKAGTISSSVTIFGNGSTSNSSNGGTVTIEAPNGSIKAGDIRSDGQLSGGNINLTSGNSIIDTTAGTINSSSQNGISGAVTLTAPGDVVAGNINASGQLGGGGINLTSSLGNIDTTAGILNSSSLNGSGGAVALNAPLGNITAGELNTRGGLGGGNISLTSPSGTVSLIGAVNSSSNSANTGNGGDVEISTRRFAMANGATVSANTNGAGTGRAGNFIINASESLKLSEASSLAFNAFDAGGTGDFTIITPKITLQNGSRISATTSGITRSGSFIVNASDSVEVSGISAVDGRAGGLFFDTTSGGEAGELRINTGRLSIRDGARISNITQGVGQGGSLSVTTSQPVEVSGSSSGLSFEMLGEGDANGLKIAIQTGQLIIEDGAQVSVNGRGSGNAGELNITASSIFMNKNGRLTATTESGQGGNINLRVQDSITLRNDSDIRADATKGSGNGGNINIDAGNFVLAFLPENSDVIATAIKGRGGNINTTAAGIFGFKLYQGIDTSESDFTASSQLGIDGTVAINTRDNIRLNALPDDFLNGDLALGCRAGKGVADAEFFNTGRGGKPPGFNEVSSSNTVWEDLRPPTSTINNRSDSATVTSLNSSTSDPIIEAQGWKKLPNGDILLTVQASTVTLYSSLQTPARCHVR